ncbi:MAG TPA: selenide, water dikinase SelD [Myxococcales bacterium]|nr:selenide, water dikinase SelD [Myxococcales bacterium]HAN31617.1 selenide, water dikinase SelD [Myxococcales bacterium]
MTDRAGPTIPLTSLAATAGCAAKIAQVDLMAALAHLPVGTDPRVLVGLETGDDAAVIRLSDDLGLVQTVDIFTPIVDDPFDYGRIAAANALSDVYAMGADPLSALSFVAWPMDSVGPQALAEVLRGASAVCEQAGIVISGGHSIVDKEPKFGLFVTATVQLSDMLTNTGAQVGDRLVLTKALGTGIYTTAKKRGHISAADLQPAIDSMTTLNRRSAQALRGLTANVHAVTDVTGFGLLGHLANVLRASSDASGQALGAHLHCHKLPLLDRVLELVQAGACPGGSKRNLAFAAPNCRFSPSVSEAMQLLLADAQTSGGLLIAVAPESHAALLHALAEQGVATAATIGEITNSDEPGVITVS